MVSAKVASALPSVPSTVVKVPSTVVRVPPTVPSVWFALSSVLSACFRIWPTGLSAMTAPFAY